MVVAVPARCDLTVSPCFHGCLVFSHSHFPPQSPPSHPLDLSQHSQQQLSLWDCCTIPKLQLPAAAPSGVFLAAARTVWFSFHLGCHRQAVSLSALNVSPLTQTIDLIWGSIRPLLQFSHPPRAGPILITLLFVPIVPSSYQVLRDSTYSFPLVRYSCPLSAGILHALLCLKVYSWCIHGERCTPRPLTPPPSCSPICCLSSRVSFIYLIPDMLECVTITDTKATLHIAVTTKKSFTFWLWFHFENPREICWVRKSDVYPSANNHIKKIWLSGVLNYEFKIKLAHSIHLV